ncbi:MAG: hypothetical protein ACSLFM_13010 [Tepidiformaceae bacterium]
MPPRLIVSADSSLPEENIQDCRELCRSFAAFLGGPVELVIAPSALMDHLNATFAMTEGVRRESVEFVPPQAATMSSADFVWRTDGRPDWSAMWEGFCELALYGGPPHRGDDTALSGAALLVEAPPAPDFDAIAEIRRGIWETTGLFAESAEPGWLAVTCSSRRMAAWMAAAIILENVDARCDDERLLVPASPSFRLKNEVKSIVTVVAKTHHYWQAHVAQQAAAAR